MQAGAVATSMNKTILIDLCGHIRFQGCLATSKLDSGLQATLRVFASPPSACTRVGQNRICTAYDRIFGCFLAKNTVHTPDIYMVLANPSLDPSC